jgi:hypothetical protein
MNAEYRNFALTTLADQANGKAFNPGPIPVFNPAGDIIDLIIAPKPEELTTYQRWYQEVVDEAIAEDEAREGRKK